eukprot:m51a1_g4919 hypothetical protein (282) ;mRNA; f:222504-223591
MPALLALVWALAVAAAASAGAPCHGSNTTECADILPDSPITTMVTPQAQHPCGGLDYFYGGRWLQLFAPKEVPWRYTSACFNLRNKQTETAEATVRGAVEMFAVEVATAPGPEGMPVLVPGDRVASFSFPPQRLQFVPDEWVTIDMGADFVAWSRGVFIGVNWWSCEKIGMGISTSMEVGKLVYTYEEASRQWLRCYDEDGINGKTRALGLRVDGTAHPRTSLPPSWICSAREYSDTVCSCNCGAWDPACQRDPISPNCSSASICDSSGRCTGKPMGSLLL